MNIGYGATMHVYYLNAIFIVIRYELKGTGYGFVINATLYLIGAA